MKAFIKKYYDLFLIFASGVLTTLIFLPIYQDKAVLPGFDSEGNSVTIRAFYDITPLRRLSTINLNWMIYPILTFLGVGIILTIVYFVFKRSQLKKLTTIILSVALVALGVLLLIAAPQVANY